jgi:hypothetical protein
MEPTYPSTLKVGLYATNGCTDLMSVRLEDFHFTEGKATAKAKTKLSMNRGGDQVARSAPAGTETASGGGHFNNEFRRRARNRGRDGHRPLLS